jgi:uncharacterized protein
MLRNRYEKLLTFLYEYKRVLVAFSGGCDSTFLLAVARAVLRQESVLAVTAISASLPEKEKEVTRHLALMLDVRHHMIQTEEMMNPSYTSNPFNRCYFCKDELFDKLAPLALENKMIVADGFNRSDRSDYRPGFQAAQKWKVAHPLNEADLTKKDIRILSRWMGLPTWNKPASPCLSSRIPYGTPVTSDILKQIEKAEEAVRSEGFSVVRVRHYENEARIEVPLKDLVRLKKEPCWGNISRKILACGYQKVIADPRGFESGRLNRSDAHAYERSMEIS